ncbi:MAG: hypothetical protein KJO31_04395 [Gammaproteobacteria bacterium]|nr:hypothetical protein [Gammaproteobacteria bacterium]
MRTDPKFWSDGFDIVDDPDFSVLFGDDLEDVCIDDAVSDIDARRMTSWQRLEERLDARRLHADLDDWDDWDEFLATH